MEIIQRSKFPGSRFAGVREHRLIRDSRLFDAEQGVPGWQGLGGLVYLADARFIPNGETGLHDHRDIDVVTLMVDGRLTHTGSLQDGQILRAGDVQIQRAGSDGFSHNEMNPDDSESRVIQLWVLPGDNAGSAAYQTMRPATGCITRIYGDTHPQSAGTGATLIDLALLKAEQSIDINVPFLAYMCAGKGFANEDMVEEGAMLRGEQLTFDATADTQLLIVHQAV